MNREDVLKIVDRMCATESIGCRALNKSPDARLLMDGLNIPKEAEIWEIPLDWDRQVVVVFGLPNDRNYYCLFAGVGTDGNFYYRVSIEGRITNGHVQELFDDIIVLPDDYFTNYRKEQTMWDDFVEKWENGTPDESSGKFIMLSGDDIATLLDALNMAIDDCCECISRTIDKGDIESYTSKMAGFQKLYDQLVYCWNE